MLLKRLLSKGQAAFLLNTVDENTNDTTPKLESRTPPPILMSGANKENPSSLDGDDSQPGSVSKSVKDDIILRALLNTSDLEPQVLQLESVFDLNKPCLNKQISAQVRQVSEHK
jgi:hypothetical protein